ncbi:hypothetical protein [Aestuariispira insulae]|uniref:Lipoprotein n=1 Tax=Aestuariispira insulae TaxID=1461337 RepID=A0A3D9HX21_9PROT|nr:hypothetical protein [Aestuariispira insulae]RED54048.1 hypothetical protein DFP90_101849 [Aestuariispira insulae]
MEIKRSPIGLTLAILAAGLGLSACAELDWNPLDPAFVPEKIKARMPSPVELSLDLETLQEIRPINQERLLRDPFRLRREANWNRSTSLEASGALILIQPLDDASGTMPDDPKETLALWPDLAWRETTFLDYFKTNNEIGTATWRRFSSGGQLCVVFSQAVPALKTPQGSTSLAGYYCSAAGEPLTPGQAETVVQSAKVQ